VNYGCVRSACCGIDCVYLLASYGMSGREQVGGCLSVRLFHCRLFSSAQYS